MSALAVVVLFGLLAAVTAAVLSLTGRADPTRPADDRRPGPGRPRVGGAPAWLVACGVLAFLGLVVAPKVFGAVILFLPLFWVRRGRRRQRS